MNTSVNLTTASLPQGSAVDKAALWGVDFTCAPSNRKPITVACGAWVDEALHVARIDALARMTQFQDLLQNREPWLGAFDFPFGLPRAFVGQAQLGNSMDDIIAELHRRCPSRMALRALIDAWSATRPAGSTLLHRRTDVTRFGVSSTSPLQTRYVPVAWMYFEGVAQLVKADVTVPGMRIGRTDAVALEGYPGLLAHELIGRRSYKNVDDAARRTARLAIVAALEDGTHRLAVRTRMASACRRHVLDDASGDALDAVLCLVQAAWASRQPNHGLAPSFDPVEGWIVTS